MEPEGLDEFSTVQSAHITFNSEFYGDGDSKNFNAVKNVDEEEYGNLEGNEKQYSCTFVSLHIFTKSTIAHTVPMVWIAGAVITGTKQTRPQLTNMARVCLLQMSLLNLKEHSTPKIIVGQMKD